MTTNSSAEAALFVKVTPNLLPLVFPLRWFWRWFTRRTGIFLKKGDTDKFSADPIAKFLADGIVYGEGPRFRLREQAVYFSDTFAHCVYKYDLATKRTEVVCEVPDRPTGLGWLPDGRLLISAGAETRQILVFDSATKALETYADVTSVTREQASDMVVAADGSLYLSNYGFDHNDPRSCTSTTLVRVDTARNVSVEATGMLFPNGSVITPDGKTLIVAETFDGCLTAFDIAADGKLSNRRVWAKVGLLLDGICLDAEGCVWASVLHVGIYKTAGGVIRLREGGKVVDVIGFGQNGVFKSVIACHLGTDTAGKHHLFFLEAANKSEAALMKQPKEKRVRNAVLRSIEVRVGPARSATNADYCGGHC